MNVSSNKIGIRLTCEKTSNSSQNNITSIITNSIISNSITSSTLNSNNIVNNSEVITNILEANAISSKIIESGQVIPTYSDITNFKLFDVNNSSQFEFTEMNKYLYPDLSHRPIGYVKHQTYDILNYLYNSNSITIDISNNDNTTSSRFSIPIFNSNSSLNNANMPTHTSSNNQNTSESSPIIQNRWTVLSSIPSSISKQYYFQTPELNGIFIDTPKSKMVSSSKWLNEQNNNYINSSQSISTLPSSYTLINYSAIHYNTQTFTPSQFTNASPLWGPYILNQGRLGSCYSFSTVESITYGYIRHIINTNLKGYINNISNNYCYITDKNNNIITGFGSGQIFGNNNNSININNTASEELINLATYMLPSLAYVEQLYQNSSSLINFNNTIFNQGGTSTMGIYNYLTQDSCPLELQYTYPLLNVVANEIPLNEMSNDTRVYMTEEWVRKRINDVPSYILDSAKVAKFYKINPINGEKLGFSLLSVCSKEMVQLKCIDSSQNIINNVKILLTNNYALSIGITIDSNYPIFNNGFTPIPQNVEGNHIVVIVGYDDQYKYTDAYGNNTTGCFLIQNSWGTNNGCNGYYILPYIHVQYLLDNNPFIILFNWCAVHFYDIL